MNFSKTVDTIVELRSQGAPADDHVAEYLKSSLETANIQFQTQTVFSHSRTLLLAIALMLSIVFLVGVLRRRHRMASLSALAIPLLLFLELFAGLPVLTWITFSASENIVVQYPVQHATRRVIVGTHYGEPGEPEPDRFTATVSAFLLPMTLVFLVLGLWRTAIYFGKFDFEDAHTIAVVMGSVGAIYYAAAFGTCIQESLTQRENLDPAENAASLAVVMALAEDLSQRYPRLENTWVTIAFFGHGRGAEKLARAIAREKGRAQPTYFIGCEKPGRGGGHGYILDDSAVSNPMQPDRNLIRAVNRAALGTTGRPLEIVRERTTNAKGFLEREFPSIVLTTSRPASGQGSNGAIESGKVHRGQLTLTLQLLQASLTELDRPQISGP
jgi:hypothetical protein